MCSGNFTPEYNVELNKTQAIRRSNRGNYPQFHNIPVSNRRFHRGMWQKPTALGRGWQPSVGLANLTYDEGVQKLTFLNRNRLMPFVDVTEKREIPILKTLD